MCVNILMPMIKLHLRPLANKGWTLPLKDLVYVSLCCSMLMGVMFFFPAKWFQQVSSNLATMCSPMFSQGMVHIYSHLWGCVFTRDFFVWFSLHVFSKSNERIFILVCLFCVWFCFIWSRAWYNEQSIRVWRVSGFSVLLLFFLGFFKAHHDFYILCNQPPWIKAVMFTK